MPNPRYVPRDFARNPAKFGKQGDIEWRDPDEARMSFEEEDWLIAARLQHGWAVRITDAIAKSDHGTVAEYADFLNKPARQLQAKLNGEAVLRLEDIASAHRVLGIAL